MTDKWYQEWFDEEYLHVYGHRNLEAAGQEVDFAVQQLDLKKDERILDLCCGAGRHAVNLAGKGFDRVVGVDLSRVLLHKALELSRKSLIPVYFVQADMRKLPLVEDFDVVLSYFTSFGYFTSEAENEKVLRQIARILKPGGKFLLDHINLDYQIAALEPYSERLLSNRWIIETRSIDSQQQRVNKEITIRYNDGTEKQYRESVKMYTREQLQDKLERVGLEVLQVYGDYNGISFDRDTPRMILTGHKQPGLEAVGREKIDCLKQGGKV